MAPNVPAGGGTAEPARKHLVWEEGFARQYLAAASLLAIAFGALRENPTFLIMVQEHYDTAQWRLIQLAESMSLWFVMGMLSSSCCLIQILLNSLSFGCAGLNKVFGPLRPLFLAMTTCLQVYSWSLVLKNRWPVAGAAVSTVVVVALSFLPELLEHLNRRALRRQARKLEGDAPTVAVLKLEGLGCVSCEKTVLDTLGACAGVVKSEIVFEQKQLTVWLSAAKADAPGVCSALQASLTAAGFASGLVSIRDSAAAAGTAGDCKPAAAASGGGEKCGGADASASADGAAAPQSLLQFVGAGLLASSCCLLQLGINGLSTLGLANVGCAGFNKVLGPYRWELRCVTGAWLGLLWAFALASKKQLRARRCRQLALRTAVAVFLMFLPEMLQGMASPALETMVGAKKVSLTVDGMGCEACQVYVHGVLSAHDGVINSVVDFKTGTAEVVVGDAFELTPDLLKTLELAGYSATLKRDGDGAAAGAGPGKVAAVPELIPDPSDTPPAGQIQDPNAKMPDDWDEEDDGPWGAPMVANPVFDAWKPRMLPNPAYKPVASAA